MRIYFRYVLCLLTLTLVCSVATLTTHGQPAEKEAASLLTVRGIAPKAVSLTATDLDKLPQRSVKVKDQGGEEIAYEGVPLNEALKRAGMDFEADRHGRGLTRYLLAEAADKYRIVYALPEIDPEFTDRLILLATKREGKPLSNEEGPLRIIVPDEKRQARWMRQVRILTIVDAVPPAERNKKP